MLGPLPDWSDCPNMDQVVAAWIKPRYKRYIKDRFTLETPSGNRFTPVIGDEKWWKRFEDSKMADVDVQFERRKSPVAPESLHVKVTVEAKGSTVRATLHDWSGGWESTWSWSGTLVGKRGWLLDWSQCHIVDMETPSPPKRKSPRNLLDDPAVDDDDGRETHV